MANKFIFNPFTGKLDLIPDISGLCPYTGATADVDLGSYKITSTGVKSKNDIILTSGRKLIFDGS